MHAIVQRRFGDPSVLQWEHVDDPVPGDGEVRIVVGAAGVHLVDTTIRKGEPFGPLGVAELPMTPGREVAGVVDAGDAEWIGRRVVAHLGAIGSGGYAELALAAVTSLHELPDDVDLTHAVAMIGTGRTAMAILEVAAIDDADVVIITGAAGGLGSLLVQAAAAAGATVCGLAGGPDKGALVRALGAQVSVDYRDPRWEKRLTDELDGRSPTLVLDGVGGAVGRSAFDLLAPGGRFVGFGYSSGAPVAFDAGDLMARSLTASWAIGPRIVGRPGGIRSLESAALAALDHLSPQVHTFSLRSAAAAHAALEARGTTGKVVLVP
jgi:NADPH2:quinone reductase